VGKPEKRRALGRPRSRWEDNTKMDLREVGWGHILNRFGSGLEQIEGSCKSDNEPSGFLKCGEFID
jgi:hypothetical protein